MRSCTQLLLDCSKGVLATLLLMTARCRCST